MTIDRFDTNTFGFYALNGENTVAIKNGSSAEEICDFLRTIWEDNPVGPIILVLDQYSSHLAGDVKELVDVLGIKLVFLTQKAPDPNPIEQLIGNSNTNCHGNSIGSAYTQSGTDGAGNVT